MLFNSIFKNSVSAASGVKAGLFCFLQEFGLEEVEFGIRFGGGGGFGGLLEEGRNGVAEPDKLEVPTTAGPWGGF